MQLEEVPELDRPNIIAAFQGWNDAGQAATTAVRFLVESLHASALGRIDPEEYFSFTDTRPTVRIVEGTQRELVWPTNELYWYSGGAERPDAVLLLGTEPNLKWRAFCDEIISVAHMLKARRVVTMGALITDSVHTRPVPLTGFATDTDVAERLVSRDITRSSYEGPTGIVGTLHSLCVQAEIPTASVWAATPYYLGSTPNPKTALGLLDALDDALALHLNLSELRTVADDFVQQVSLAVRDNDDVRERIRTLEEAYDAMGPQLTQPQPDLPDSGAIIADLEEFLRDQQRGE